MQKINSLGWGLTEEFKTNIHWRFNNLLHPLSILHKLTHTPPEILWASLPCFHTDNWHQPAVVLVKQGTNSQHKVTGDHKGSWGRDVPSTIPHYHCSQSNFNKLWHPFWIFCPSWKIGNWLVAPLSPKWQNLGAMRCFFLLFSAEIFMCFVALAVFLNIRQWKFQKTYKVVKSVEHKYIYVHMHTYVEKEIKAWKRKREKHMYI